MYVKCAKYEEAVAEFTHVQIIRSIIANMRGFCERRFDP